MRKIFAGIVIGAILGSAGTAVGSVANSYWSRGGNSYICNGIASGVICKERTAYGLYRVAITPSFVGINRGSKVLMGCDRGFKDSYDACFRDDILVP